MIAPSPRSGSDVILSRSSYDGLSIEAGQEKNVSTTDPLRFPGEKPGSIVTPHEPVILDKILQSHKKLEAAEPWVPAFEAVIKLAPPRSNRLYPSFPRKREPRHFSTCPGPPLSRGRRVLGSRQLWVTASKAGTYGSAASTFLCDCTTLSRITGSCSVTMNPGFRRGSGMDRLSKHSCPASKRGFPPGQVRGSNQPAVSAIVSNAAHNDNATPETRPAGFDAARRQSRRLRRRP